MASTAPEFKYALSYPSLRELYKEFSLVPYAPPSLHALTTKTLCIMGRFTWCAYKHPAAQPWPLHDNWYDGILAYCPGIQG